MVTTKCTKVVVSVILLLHTAFSITAQDFKADIKKMQEKYKDLKTLHMKISVAAFENEKATTPFFTQHSEVKKEDDNYLTKSEQSEILMTDKLMISVNHEIEEMIYQPRKEKYEIAMNDVMNINLDSMLSLYDNIKYVGIEKGNKHYILFQKDAPISKMDLFIDARAMVIKKLYYHYNEAIYGAAHFVKINYTQFNTHPNFPETTFSRDNYLYELNGKLIPQNEYKGYRFEERELQKKKKLK